MSNIPTPPPPPPKNFPEPNRFITDHDETTGKAVFSKALPEESPMFKLPIGAEFSLAYLTSSFPAEMNGGADVDGYKTALSSPPGLVQPGGTILRYVDFHPANAQAPVLMHRTVSLDYAIVLEGEIELGLDSGEKRILKRGDCAVQRGTMHSWRNTSETEWARMMFVLQDSKELVVDGKTLGEDYGDAANTDIIPPSRKA